jgi:hypothetical protein
MFEYYLNDPSSPEYPLALLEQLASQNSEKNIEYLSSDHTFTYITETTISHVKNEEPCSIIGPTDDKNVSGPTGYRNVSGPTGYQGGPGITGPTGYQGGPGITGPTGIRGVDVQKTSVPPSEISQVPYEPNLLNEIRIFAYALWYELDETWEDFKLMSYIQYREDLRFYRRVYL